MILSAVRRRDRVAATGADGELDPGSLAAPRGDLQLASDEQSPFTHAGNAETPAGPTPGVARPAVGREALPVVGHQEHGPAHERQLHVGTPGPGMLGDVGQALLGYPVDDQLLLGGERQRRAGESESSLDAGLLAEVPDLAAQRRDQTMIVEHRRPEGPGQGQELVHGLGGQPLGLQELAPKLVRRPLDRGLEAQRDRCQGLVDLVVEILSDPPALALLGPDGLTAGASAFALQAPDHALEGGLEPANLSAAPGWSQRPRPLWRGQVSSLHGRNELVEGSEAAV